MEGWVPLVLDHVRLRSDGRRGPGGERTGRTRLDLRRCLSTRALTNASWWPDANERGSGRHRIWIGVDAAGRTVHHTFAEDRSRVGHDTYRLRDTTHARDIVTYDVAASAGLSDGNEMADGILNATAKSEEPKATNTGAPRLRPHKTPTARRRSSQRWMRTSTSARSPVVHALAGSRAGWDDGKYSVNWFLRARLSAC